MTNRTKVLALEPYYGGSHRGFLDGLAGLLPDGLDLITLPPRKWKWRMRLSAPWLAAELAERAESDAYGCLLCSTFVDVATLKGLVPAWCKTIPVVTYFHENQFAYPVRRVNDRDLHFSLTNLTTALASDRLAFNSHYNLETFLSGSRQLLKKSPDMRFSGIEEEIRGKAAVIHPGQDFAPIDRAANSGRRDKVPVIVWNHRWEHDKNPERFFEALYELDRRGIDFRLVVLGESFAKQPPVFEEARTRLAARILHFGYMESRREYAEWLKRGDVAVSTAGHEFFGISVVEAVRAGCRPLLPARLSYPELFPAEFIYRDEDLVPELIKALGRGGLGAVQARELTERFSWQRLEADYRKWLFG